MSDYWRYDLAMRVFKVSLCKKVDDMSFLRLGEQPRGRKAACSSGRKILAPQNAERERDVEGIINFGISLRAIL